MKIKFMIKLLFLLLVIILNLSACGKPERNIVYTTGRKIMIEMMDNDPVRIINDSKLIVKAKVTKAEEPFYYNLVSDMIVCNCYIKINEILKGDELVSVGDEIYISTLNGYMKFKDYVSGRYHPEFTESEFNKFKNDENAYVACYFLESLIPEEGSEYIFILTEYDGDGRKAHWYPYSDRSGIISVNENELEGYGTKMFGTTYDGFKQIVEDNLKLKN
jgi:hypothetical protein